MSGTSCPQPSSLAKPLVIAALVLCLAATGFAQLNLVYTMTNTGLCPTCSQNQNAILAFSNDGTGHLTRIGKKFSTRGTGLYDPAPATDFDEDGQLITNAAGSLLFAVNMHSNTIAVLNINSDGTVKHVQGSPYPSNGPQPASLGYLENGSILIVANKDADPSQTQTNPNYSTFDVAGNGTLSLNASATVQLPAGASPATALVNQRGKLLMGILFGTSPNSLSAYRIHADGTLELTSTVGPPAPGTLLLGAAQHPVNSELYVGEPDLQQVASYTFGISTGILALDNTTPNSGKAICWLITNKAGTRLYTSETNSSTISVYDITHSKLPVRMQNLALQKGAASGATNLALDPTEQFLYVLVGNGIHVLNVAADGTLSETIHPVSLPVQPGTVAQGLVTLMK